MQFEAMFFGMSSTVPFFFLSVPLTIHNFLNFHVNLGFFSISVNVIGILIGNEFNLYMTFSNIGILAISVLLINECGRCLHFLLSSTASSFTGL